VLILAPTFPVSVYQALGYPILYRKNGMTNSLKQTKAANATKNPNTQNSVIVDALYGF
jgi:hypothetical protein